MDRRQRLLDVGRLSLDQQLEEDLGTKLDLECKSGQTLADVPEEGEENGERKVSHTSNNARRRKSEKSRPAGFRGLRQVTS